MLSGRRPAVLERVGPTHAAALAAIHAAAFPPAERWDAGSIAATLALPGVAALLDPRGGMAIWRVAADEAELATLAVAPAARRAGIGGRLLRAVLTDAATHGAAALFLEVKAVNHGARRLYAAAGFVTVGQRPRYYPDGADALVLRLGLGLADQHDVAAGGVAFD